jgi:hypothetical protein
VVDYEEVCRAPHAVVERVADEILKISIDGAAVRAALPPLSITNRITVQPDEFDRIEATLSRLAASAPHPSS